MNSDEQNHKALGSEQMIIGSHRSDTWQIVASSVVLVVVGVGILIGLTHLMLPQWLAAMNENRQKMPEAIQLLMWMHHTVLAHWKIAILSLVVFGTVASTLLYGATGKSDG